MSEREVRRYAAASPMLNPEKPKWRRTKKQALADMDDAIRKRVDKLPPGTDMTPWAVFAYKLGRISNAHDPDGQKWWIRTRIDYVPRSAL